MLSSASDFASQVDGTFFFIFVVSLIFFVGIVAAMFYFMVKYHHTKRKTVENIDGNLTLEFLWTIIPTILVMFMFYYGVVSYDYMRDVPDDAYEIKATARKWSWSFTYPNGFKDTKLTVPRNKAVKINIEAEDVLHSFYIPAFRVKMDAVPGMDTYVWFRAIENGTFEIFCTEYCGDNHSYMLSSIDVVSAQKFDDWYANTNELLKNQDNDPIAAGAKYVVTNGCVACHSSDGSQTIGPTFKGLFGKSETVITDGNENDIVVDENYLINSILNPSADIVKGFETVPMPKLGLSEKEVNGIVEYIKSLQ